MIQPNMATLIPAMIIVFVPVPSQTIKSGARADLGKLFNITKVGSIISDKVFENHKRLATTIPIIITRKKLKIVSYKVTQI